MSNTLKMVISQAVIGLLEKGWSYRKIARELKIDRGTVAKYDQKNRDDNPNPAIPPAGCEVESSSKPAISPTGNLKENRNKKPPGRPSQSAEHSEIILTKLEQGLSAQRIWQDLVSEYGFTNGYDSVKRFVRGLEKRFALPFRRMEVMPGKEMQVDFGSGAWIIDGKHKRKSHVFRTTLSFSRKSYSEAVFKQDTESFIRCMENSFWEWGGVPETIVIDNLKAAVTEADWYDPELNPKILSFARHYNVVILPTKPYTPRHKGKIESGIKYVKNNGLKGKAFKTIEEENEHLREWESRIADTRIHGTTKEQVSKLFIEKEKRNLKPLPAERFPFFHEGHRSVHRDGHVEIDKAYYSVPPEYVGSKLWVRWDSRLIRIFNSQMDQIAVHAKVSAGKFNTDQRHLASSKISAVERGAEYFLEKICKIGFETGQWAKAMLADRGIEGVRVLQGLMALSSKYPSYLLNQACRTAVYSNSYRLKTLKQWLRKNENQKEFEFVKNHPLIRPLSEYQNIIHVSFKPKNEEPNHETTVNCLSQTASFIWNAGHTGNPGQ
jgi:transposase